jgi:hypothetical protein
MSFGLPSRVFGSDFQNGSAVQLRNNRCNRWRFSHEGAYAIRWTNLQILSRTREGAKFQFRNFCKGVDERRAFIRNTGDTDGGTALRALDSRVRCPRPYCYVNSAFDDNMPSITELRVSGQLPAETVKSFYSKDASSPAIGECRDAADCHVGQAGSSFLAVRCNADSSDKGKVRHRLL